MNNFPIDINTFKMFFLREAGLEYQPYNTWAKTVWDTGEYCIVGKEYFRSLVDTNINAPYAEPSDWERVVEEYVEGGLYDTGDIVYYASAYWKALAVTNKTPGAAGFWTKVDPTVEFPNARVWATPVAYSKGSNVIAIVNYRVGVYTSLEDDNYADPSNEDKWEEDSEQTVDLQDVILDVDIMRAMSEASFKFNRSLFQNERGKMIFLYLTMFFLVYDRQMASAGMNGNSAAGPVIHRRVGKMAVTYAQSKLFTNYPSYEFLASNDYGRKAFNLMRPYLTGGVQVLQGAATGD